MARASPALLRSMRAICHSLIVRWHRDTKRRLTDGAMHRRQRSTIATFCMRAMFERAGVVELDMLAGYLAEASNP
jgi:hypothetical protein